VSDGAATIRRMAIFHVVLHRSGPRWDPGKPLQLQSNFAAHAEYVDKLVDTGVIIMGGPLADEYRVVYAVAADSEEAVRTALLGDPWNGTHLCVASIDRWTIRLGGPAG
jgi:uncharacterized protein YciI